MKTTSRPTAWDQYYVSKPTDLSDLYPDCFGSAERLEDERLARKVRWVSRLLTLLIAISASMVALHFLERFL